MRRSPSSVKCRLSVTLMLGFWLSCPASSGFTPSAMHASPRGDNVPLRVSAMVPFDFRRNQNESRRAASHLGSGRVAKM
jgi:hypothetical protein